MNSGYITYRYNPIFLFIDGFELGYFAGAGYGVLINDNKFHQAIIGELGFRTPIPIEIFNSNYPYFDINAVFIAGNTTPALLFQPQLTAGILFIWGKDK